MKKVDLLSITATLVGGEPGKECGLYEYCNRVGFVDIPEGILKTCHKELVEEAPENNKEGMEPVQCPSSADEIVLSLMRNHDPALAEGEAKRRLFGRNKLEDLNGIVDLDDDAMRDVMVDNDRKDLQDRKTEAKAKFEKKRVARAKINGFVTASYRLQKRTPRRGAPQPGEPGADFPNIPNSRERWVAQIKGKHIVFLKKWCPWSVGATQNDTSGQYLLYLTGGDRRGVSWTRRGQTVAVVDAVKTAWRMHFDVFGEQCPFPSEYLVSETERLCS
jgi:hypothetical protein